jgi:hypothetical protein
MLRITNNRLVALPLPCSERRSLRRPRELKDASRLLQRVG